MWHIIRNGMRRWWWLYALAAIGSVFSVMVKDKNMSKLVLTSGVLLYGCGMLFVFEVAGVAKFRVFGMLPVSRRQIGLAFGVLWIAIVPPFHIAVYVLSRLVHVVAPGLVPEGLPLNIYAPAMLFCVGATCIFVMFGSFSQHFPQGWIRNTWDFCSSFIMMFLFAFTCYFIYRLGLPAHSEPLGPEVPFVRFVDGIEFLIGRKHSLLDLPELVVLAVAAAGIMYFLLRVENIARFLFTVGVARGGESQAGAPAFFGKLGNSSRTYGVMEPWMQELRDGVRIMGLLAFACLAIYVLNWVFIKQPTLDNMSVAANTSDAFQWPLIMIIIAGLVCLPPMVPWLMALRTLRALPLSRNCLTWYLVSFPLVAFLIYSLVAFAVCTYFRGLHFALNMEWWMLFVFGLSLISVSLLMLSRHAIVAAIAVMLPAVLTAVLALHPKDPVTAMQETAFWIKAGSGVVLIASGYLLLYAVIARSGTYRSKPWMGAA